MISETEYRAVIGALLEHLAAEGHGSSAYDWHQDVCQTCADMKRADTILQNLDKESEMAVRRKRLEEHERRKDRYAQLPPPPHARKRS